MDCIHIKFVDGKKLGGRMHYGDPTQPEHFSVFVSQ